MFFRTKKNLSRGLSFVILIVMTLSVLPVTILADELETFETFADSRIYEYGEWEEEYYTCCEMDCLFNAYLTIKKGRFV
ncbi:MAG: hypothetical protein FWE02_06950 [Defluviitaleaceae bacterium]|nr:hypothetical protein [Defluviitaleaceae bacterium]